MFPPIGSKEDFGVKSLAAASFNLAVMIGASALEFTYDVGSYHFLMSQDDYQRRDSGVATLSLSRCKSTASNGYKQGQGASERQTDKVRAASAGMA